MTRSCGYRELAACYTEGRDFQVVVREGRIDTVILAIHGGRIESGTAEIASLLAGTDCGLYLFKGIRPEGNAALHLPSTRFDDPRVLALVAGARTVVSVHGCRGESEFLLIGGRDQDRRARLSAALPAAGIPVEVQAPDHMRGLHKDNICNLGLTGKGLQLEISAGLRRRLVGSQEGPLLPEPPALLADFSRIIREAIR